MKAEGPWMEAKFQCGTFLFDLISSHSLPSRLVHQSSEPRCLQLLHETDHYPVQCGFRAWPTLGREISMKNTTANCGFSRPKNICDRGGLFRQDFLGLAPPPEPLLRAKHLTSCVMTQFTTQGWTPPFGRRCHRYVQ